jgi:hypothetical protein
MQNEARCAGSGHLTVTNAEATLQGKAHPFMRRWRCAAGRQRPAYPVLAQQVGRDVLNSTRQAVGKCTHWIATRAIKARVGTARGVCRAW